MNRLKLERPLNIKIILKGEKIFEKVFEEYPIILGRSSKCDIPLPQVDFLSRQHCSVTIENSKVLIVDLESVNGIYLGKNRVRFTEIIDKLKINISELEVFFEFQMPQAIPLHQMETLVTKEGASQGVRQETKPRLPFSTPQMSSGAQMETTDCPVVSEQSRRNLPTKSGITSPRNKFGEVDFKKEKSKKKKTEQQPQAQSKHDNSVIQPHAQASQLRPQQRVLEGYVTWKDQIYDVSQYYPGQQVIIGSQEETALKVPIVKKPMVLAHFDGMNTHVFIPNSLRFELHNETKKLDFEEAIHSPLISKKKNYMDLKMNGSDVVSVQISNDVFVHFRYVPAPRQLSRDTGFLKDEGLKEKTFISGIIHFILFLSILLTEPKEKGPHIKNVPDRYARLLVKKPEPIKKIEPPKPPEKKVAEKKPEPPKPHENTKKIVKVEPKIHKIVKLQRSKVLAKVNKWPVEVAKPMKPVEKPVVQNIQAVGALAALNAFSSKAPSNVPVAININKNAGGQSALNTGGVIGALKTNSGKLAAGGFAAVKTKGLGYGTGTGYGVQGIQGTAGGRSIAGAIVGAPALVHFTKQEGLTREQVMSVVKQHMSEIQQCYERSLIDNPKLSGRVEYEWEISAGGNVQYAKVKKSDVASGDNLNNCVTGIFKAMKFPIAKNGQTTVPNIGFPFGRL